MTATAGTQDQPAPGAAAWLGFLAMCVGMFMAVLDIQIVATSLPAIHASLGIPAESMSWVQTSYLIAEVIAIPLTGFLTRVLTLRGLFVACAMVFLIASAGCASSTGLSSLIAWRTLQGFAGGMSIPIVFTAAFLLFPGRGQRLATTLAGMLAVLAPTVGPVAGGYITQTWSWHWLFLVNIVPGVIAIAVGWIALPRGEARMADILRLDVLALAVLGGGLATLEIGLKEAPRHGWVSLPVGGLLTAAFALGVVFVSRMLRRPMPFVDLRLLTNRNLAFGSMLSFILGVCLYGNVYLMPVFLAFVAGYDAFEIGSIMLVTGAAQLVAAPLVIALERYIDALWLSLAGFALFAVGLAMSSWDTPRADYDEMFYPQIVRGIAIMLCLLPPTRIALGGLPQVCVPDASALFNLMRNLGGAVGLALIDTVLFGRAPGHGLALAERLLRLEPTAFRYVGLPMPTTPITDAMQEMARPLVERAALTLAVGEAWAMLAAISAVGFLLTIVIAGSVGHRQCDARVA